MKRLAAILLLGLIAACVSFGVCYRLALAPTVEIASKSDAELEWLRSEFHLDATQFAAIQKLHHDHAPRCEQMYRRIRSVYERADHLMEASHQVTPELDQALKECSHLDDECRRESLRHAFAVAAHMSPKEGDRYLRLMRARIMEPGVVRHVAAAQIRR
jgi:hypothetical protein